MWANFPDAIRAEILETGRWERPSPYDPEPYLITKALIEDGRRHLLLGAPIAFRGPVHILQGMQDTDVPWRHALKLVEALESTAVTLELIKDGDHRLSRPEDISRLLRVATSMTAQN
ncbi:MAG: hypothetical protein WDM79_12280 [Terricaulis sp.]